MSELRESMAADFLIWENLERVTYQRRRRAAPAADTDPQLRQGVGDGLAADVWGRQPSPDVAAVVHAKRRAISTKERLASAGAYLGSDVNWWIPVAQLPDGFSCKPGDAVVEESGRRWTVLTDVQLGKLGNSWKLPCRNLALAFDLRDEIDVERPGISYDEAGAALKAWPSGTRLLGGLKLAERLAARVQPLTREVAERRGVEGFETRFDVIVEREVDVDHDDRIKWGDVYLDVVGYRSAERIDELPVIEAVRAV